MFVETPLFDLYAKCDNLDFVWKSFEKMYEGNESSWNAISSDYSENGLGDEAQILFKRMQRNGFVNREDGS